MGSGDKESLQEYEKDYLARLEQEQNPADLQSLIHQMSQQTKVHERNDYVGLCAACTEGVDRKEMVYKNSHLFHPDCFKQHGNEYQTTTNLMNEERKTKVDLVYLKNLQVRSGNLVSDAAGLAISEKTKPRIKKKSKKKAPLKKKTKAKRRKTRRHVKTKRRIKTKSKRKIRKRRKISRKRFIRKRRPKRRITRYKIGKSSRKRKSKRRR